MNNIISGSPERKRNESSKPKNKSSKSRRSRQSQEQNTQGSLRHRKQEQNHTKSPRKTTEEGQDVPANDIKGNITKKEISNWTGGDHSRQRRQNKKKEGMDRKATRRAIELQNWNAEGEMEVKSTSRRKKRSSPGRQQNRDTGRSRQINGIHEPQEATVIPQSTRKESKQNLEPKIKDQQIYDVIDWNESDEELILTNDLDRNLIVSEMDQISPGPWKIPSFARILTHEEVMRDFHD